MSGEIRTITWSGGPTGDYTTDGTHDETEINTAMSWANSNPNNILKMLGTGNDNAPHLYNIEGQIKIANNVTWMAEAGVKLWVPDGACGTSPDDCIFPNGTPVIGQLNAYVANVEIYGFTVSGNCNNQSTKLGYAHGVNQSAGSGCERLFGFKGASGSGTKCTNIYIHDMVAVDSFGEFVHIMFGRGNIRIANCYASNHQHDAVMWIEVDGDGNEITNSTFYGITDSCVRLDNCKNVPVHDCDMFAYSGDHNNGAAKYGHNGMQIANEANKSLLTDGIQVYNCYFEGPSLDGIWINDQLKTAGANSQSIYIHHCKFSNQIAWADWASWSSGIAFAVWGNGVKIEYCTFDGCYANGIMVTGGISSTQTHKLEVSNCNITNTLGKRSGSSNGPSVQGWGMYNAAPTKVSVVATNIYMSGNVSGNYKGITPVSESTSPIENAEPGGGKNEDDDDDYTPPDSSGVYIPPSASIIDTDFPYVEREADDFKSYINNVPFEMVKFLPTGVRGTSEAESASFIGTNLGDLGLKGSEIEITGIAETMDDLYKIKAAMAQDGRSFLELGGSRKGYFISGLMSVHASSEDMAAGDVPGENLTFSATIKTEFPYQETMIKKVRDHYINGSCIVSSDDIHSGNIVKNNNLSGWSVPTNLEWSAVEDAADNSWRNVKYAKEIKQWCAVAQTGTGNRIMVSGANILPDVSGNNKHGIHTIPGVTAIDTGGLTFDGVDGFVSLPDPGVLNTAGWTIYSKFSVSDVTLNRCLYGIGKNTDNVSLNFYITTGRKVIISLRDDTTTLYTLTSTNEITLNEPHEVVITYSGSTISIYIDGAFDSSTTWGYGIITTNSAIIGRLSRSTPYYLFLGDIYSTRVFSEALPTGDIPAAGTRTTNLVCGYSDITTQEPGKFWIVPPWLSQASNCDSNLRGLTWCPDWMMWIATSISGASPAVIKSKDGGATWTSSATPANGNAWGNGVFIDPNETVTTGRFIMFAQSGTGNKVAYTDDKCATWTEVAIPVDIAGNTLIASAYSPSLHRIAVVSYTGSASRRVMCSDDYAATWVSVSSPAQKWTGIIWAELLGMFVACSEDGDQQIMTSATGLSGWTLQTTPYAYSTVEPGDSTVVQTLTDTTPLNWNYTTRATSYTDNVNPMKVFTTFAPAAGNHIRIDRIGARLRVVTTGPTAYLKVTAKTATIAETTLVEWTETATTYQQKGYECAFEGAAGEAVTLTYYLKSTSGSVRAGADNMGYTASEMTAGSSSITYYRNQWRGITYSQDLNLAVVVCQDTANVNYVMYSNTGTNWYQTESIARQGWVSVEYSDNQKAFIAVATSGTNRVKFSEGYGELVDIAPDYWTKVKDGQEASEEHAGNNTRCMLIRGNGTEEKPGYIYQKLPFDSMYDAGELYILQASAYVEGLTSGRLAVDIYAGGTIVKELTFDANTSEITTKDIRFKFDTIPPKIYIRVHGSGTPNDGALFYISKTLVSKVSEYENDDVGAPIATEGYFDSMPNIKLKGVGTAVMSGDSSRIIEDTDPEYYSTSAITYGTAIKTVTLPALTGGSIYKLNALSFKFKVNSMSAYIYCKTTIQAASLFGGVETDISMYTTNETTLQYRKYTLKYNLQSATNEEVKFRLYIRISKTGYIGTVTDFWYQFEEVLDASTTKDVPIYLYNTNDSRIVLQVCESLPPGYQAEINKNGTGSYRYLEAFADDNYVSNAHEVVGGVTRDATDQTLHIPAGGSITFPMASYYPTSGMPFIKMLVVSGIPQIAFAIDTGSGPGTFYAVDSNTTEAVENSEVVRVLNTAGQAPIRGNHKYYVKIYNLSGKTCEFGQMLIYGAMDTIDVRRLKIYAAINPNSIAVQVGGEGKCSAVLSVEFRDTQIIS